MQKIQILFPDPQMQRLREAARREDRPVSEIVRRAVEAWLERLPAKSRRPPPPPPVFHGGLTYVTAADMRDTAWAERIVAERPPGE